jgi:hypothetical protein
MIMNRKKKKNIDSTMEDWKPAFELLLVTHFQILGTWRQRKSGKRHLFKIKGER